MQVTIEISDELAAQCAAQQGRLAALVERALRQQWWQESALGREVIGFLARGPQPEEIVAFRPSDHSVQRIRELLERNGAGTLSAAEEAELDEVSVLNRVFTRIKAEARQHLRRAS
jgi:hypothetical protein